MKSKIQFLALLSLLLSTAVYAQKYIYDIDRTEYHDDMLY